VSNLNNVLAPAKVSGKDGRPLCVEPGLVELVDFLASLKYHCRIGPARDKSEFNTKHHKNYYYNSISLSVRTGYWASISNKVPITRYVRINFVPIVNQTGGRGVSLCVLY